MIAMTSRPNVMLLVGEDVGYHLGCCGEAYARTPNLDRLARQGVFYRHAFSTAPVCAPSRSSIVTGMYPWSLGTMHMRSRLLDPPRLFTQELHDAGYYVSWFTKTDFNFEPPADFADDTDDWLERLRCGRMPASPWLVFRNFAVTHESTMWEDEAGDSAARQERLNLASTLPSAHRHDPAEAPVPAYLPDHDRVRRHIATYHDALSIADGQIGEVLAALDESPYADNTVVIYLSDHGRGLPREKRWCYGAGVHLPLIVRQPNGESAGGVSKDLVSWVDIAPTILSLAGVTIPGHYQGRAFLGPARSGARREYVFAGRDRMDEAFDHVRVARDRRWHYIRNGYPALPYAQRIGYMERMGATQVLREMHAADTLQGPARAWMSETKPPEELYDAMNDPDMVRNLADAPAHAAKLERMRVALDVHLEEVGDLGARPERELIASGLVADELSRYAERIEPLPERHRIGPPTTILEQAAAAAYRPSA